MATMGMMPNIERERQWLLAEKYGGVPSEEYEKDILRLEAGEPVAYVIGFSKFLGCHIDLSFRPLIPRTETEYWVGKAIDELTAIHGKDAKLRFLDIFSGSGCIGIALLSHFPNASVDFADIDGAALRQIRKNTELSESDPARYAVYQSDVFEGIPQGEKYDAIFANPPYIAEKDIDRVERSVLVYEPRHALFAENDGFLLIERTMSGILHFLKPNGSLYLEFDDIQKDILQKMFPNAVFDKDQFGLFRWMKVTNS